MRRKALGAIVSFILLASSCAKKVDRDVSHDEAASAAPRVAAAPANASAPACEAGSGTCTDDERGEACVDGKKTPVRCAAGSVCAAGACAPLGGLPKDAFAAIGKGALVNRWSMEPHIQLHTAETIERAIVAKAAFEGISERVPAPACSSSGAMPVPRKSSDAGTTYSMFKGTIAIGRDDDVELGMGVQGNGKLYLDGVKVFDLERDTGNLPMVDEDLATLHLGRGGHEVVVLVEEATAPMSFILSARAKGAGPRALLFAPGKTASATCADAELADLGFTKKPISRGFSVDLHASFHGLVPRKSVGLPISLELLTPAPHGRRNATEIIRAVAEEGGYADDVEIKTEHEANWLRASLGQGGEAVVEEPLLYRGDLHERIAKLAAELPRIEASKAPESARASVEWDIQELTSALGRNDGDLGYLETRAAEAERVVPGVLEGKDPYVGRSGVLHKAYRSRLDGSLQPYLVNVPRKPPKGKVGYPVIFAIHGLNGEPGQALRTVVGLAPDREKMNAPYEMRHLPPLPTYNALIVAPDGYGNSGQRLPGEDDVLRVLEEIEAVYPVDPNRVTITGYSLGGTVSFVVPLHYPSIFAASGPLCGYPNFSEWPIIRDAPKLPWEEVLVARKSIVHYAENGMYLPLFMIHGGQDGPHRSRMMADRYHELGYRRTLDVQDDLDHDVWDYGYDKGKMVGWLRARARPEHPKRLRFVTGEARYDQNRWVKVLGIADDTKFASVDAEWDEEAKRTLITTKNVAALALGLKEAGILDGAALIVDGKSLGTADGDIAYVDWSSGAPARVEKEPARAGKKRAGVAGPIDDVQRHSAVVVYGTLRADETEANHLVADHLAAILHSTLRFPVKSDTEVTEAELATKSVILVGRPATNKITALFASALPATFEPNAATVRKKRHEGADVGVALIQPNPKNAGEYLVLYAGVRRAGTLEARNLPQLVPDYLVYDKRITALRGALTLGKVKVRDGGFFDASWK